MIQKHTPDAIVQTARTWIGTPYHHQMSVKGFGTDCLGLVRGVWRDLYGAEPEQAPPYTRDWAEGSGREMLLEAARRHFIEIPVDLAGSGDILAFRWRVRYPVKHLGVLIERHRLVHAFEGLPVTEIRLSPWWWRRVASAFRFPSHSVPTSAPDQPIS